MLDFYWEQHASRIASCEQAAITIRHFKRLMPGAQVVELADAENQQDYVDARHEEGIKPATIARELSVLRAAVRVFAEHTGSRAPRIYAVDPGEPRDRWLTPTEVERLLEASRSRHTSLFILLMLATAARPEAILDLTWQQVDFRTGRVHLNPPGRQQTNKRRPIVRLDERTLALLEEIARRQLGSHVITYSGFAVGSVKKSFRAAVERAGLDPKTITPYVLRHTAATWMAQAGVPLWEIAGYLGHKDTRMVERHYAHHHPDYMNRAKSALAHQLATIRVDQGRLLPTELVVVEPRPTSSRQKTSRQKAENPSSAASTKDNNSLKEKMVGATGIEPVTPTMST